MLSLLQAFLGIFSLDLTPFLAGLLEGLSAHLPVALRAGIYEVLAYEACLELHDARGERTVFHKRQRVRYRQDNIIAYQDMAWGDGQIFADYRCSPGVAVDRYREGHRYHILIALHQTRQRGDIDEFHLQRTILEGFMSATEDLQLEINHHTRRLKIEVIFPPERPPQRAWVLCQNAATTETLGRGAFYQRADGRHGLRWRTQRPRLYEAYILRWQW